MTESLILHWPWLAVVVALSGGVYMALDAWAGYRRDVPARPVRKECLHVRQFSGPKCVLCGETCPD